MLQLPVELRRDCIDLLKYDAKTLKALRLSCDALSILATESLFRTAILNNISESANKFTELIESTLNGLVCHVIINTSDDPDHEGTGYEEETDIAENFEEAIALLSRLNKLEHLELKYADNCAVDRSEYTREVHETERVP